MQVSPLVAGPAAPSRGAVLLLLACCGQALPAQEPEPAQALRELLPRFRADATAVTEPAAVALFAAAAAAIERQPAALRTAVDFVMAVGELADAAIRGGHGEAVSGWLLPIDQQLATAADPADRHRLAAVVGLAQRAVRRPAAALTRLRTAYADLDTDPPVDAAMLHAVARELAAAHGALRQHRESLPIAIRVVAMDRERPPDPSLLLFDLRRLGNAHHWVGQRQGAYDAFREALDLARAHWPADHDEVLVAIEDFAATNSQLGDYRAAYELLCESLQARERRQPPDARDVLAVKQRISQVLVQLDDLETAARLQAEVLAVLAVQPDRDEHLYVTGLQYHARILKELGDEDGARTAIAEVIDRLQPEVPWHDRDLGLARTLLGVLERRADELDASRDLLEAAFRGLSHTLRLDHSYTQIACAELIATCRLQGDVARAAELCTILLDAAVEAVAQSTLAARQTARLVAIQDLGIDHALSLVGDPIDAATRQHLLGKVLLVSQLLEGAATSAARANRHGRRQRADELAELEASIAAAAAAGANERLPQLVRAKERLERLSQADETVAPLPGLEAIRGTLPPDRAAAAVVRYVHRRLDPTQPGGLFGEAHLAGLVLTPSGGLQFVDLGALQALVDQVDGITAATHTRLRASVIDPLRAAAPAAKVLFVVLDEALVRVPWDSLPTEAGAPVAAEVELRRLTSLLDLVAPNPTPPPRLGAASLVAVGALDYAAPAEGAPRFTALRASGAELDDLEAGFRERFPGAPCVRLDGARATKAAVAAAVPGAHVVHFATHGYFLDAQASALATSVGGGTLPIAALELAPAALSGLALSGANGPADGNGAPGLLTAAELQQFDFGTCYLAVVSACQSGVGARSEGEGLASLQESLQRAGARYVLATLWPVEDAAARHFMRLFYAALWRDPAHPYHALGDAKREARELGVSFADWAAFQLTGN
jgi:CHAT domain-containing protein/tetratricopeptide (TPR) repeat protein